VDTHTKLIELCQEVGGIAGCNGHFTAGLSRRIEATGKPLEELTLGELVALSREYSVYYNRVHGEA
jgi:hypothetical protein